jgi:polar amino acid transport system permease protein
VTVEARTLTSGPGGGVAPPARRPSRLHWRTRQRLVRWSVYGITLLVVAWVAITADWARLQETFFDPEIAREMFPEVLTVAARNTLIFTFYGFTGGMLIGVVVALMRLSSLRPYRWAATVYIETFRGIPAIITLLLIGFVLPITLDIRVPFTYGPGSVGLAIVYGAYLAETIRGGIEAVPKGQMEAARSLGMGYGRSMFTIVIPQALRIMLPPLTNELVMLLKDTSLLFVLGTTQQTIELAKFARDDVQDTFNGTPFMVVAVIYLLLTVSLTQAARWLERRGQRAR